MIVDEIHQQVHREIDRRRDEIVSLLADLVRFPSVNRPPHGDELACQLFLESLLLDREFEVDRFQPDEIPGIQQNPGWWPGSDFTDRPNIVGTRRGSGGGRSLLMLAHVDVVPEGPHDLWRHGPFNPTIEGDELIGRGAADDKSGIAGQIMALLCLESAGYRTKGDVILASVVDEESAGANGTLATLLRPHIADGAMYTDGLDLDVHIANLGGLNFELEVQVDPSFTGTTIDQTFAVMAAFLERLNQFAADRTATIEADPLYSGSAWPAFAVRTSYLEVGSRDGGNPGAIRIHSAAYVLPGEDLDGMKQHIGRHIANVADAWGDRLLSATVRWVGREMPPSAINPDHSFVDVVGNAAERATGRKPRRNGMPMSDLFQFLLNSPRPMPTVAMGPARWAVPGGVHEPNESVLIDEHLIPFVKILASVIIDWCGVEPVA